MNRDSEKYLNTGLFGYNYGTIKNLNLYNVNIQVKTTTSSFTGGIAARSYGSIINCNISGNITNEGTLWIGTGGICGELFDGGSISNCRNTSKVISINKQETGAIVVGGIVGQVNKSESIIIDRCYNKGNIIATAHNTSATVGGIVGYGRNEIKNCYNIGLIEVDSDENICIGGICGVNERKHILLL